MGAVLSCFQTIFAAIGNCLMTIVHGIGAVLTAIVNGVVTVLDAIISFVTCDGVIIIIIMQHPHERRYNLISFLIPIRC
ncbi:hypothetical protein VTN49DRAFT_5461 [Thermomyces lanuginosus]|uniref:uncharacterized protein n=1 Tax=Thermomyces lanuginosus TaxID=5541 RepID=UPI0037441795